MGKPDRIDILRDFAHTLSEFEEQLEDILPPPPCLPTNAQIHRWDRTRDAAARLRRQIHHLAAEMLIGRMGSM